MFPHNSKKKCRVKIAETHWSKNRSEKRLHSAVTVPNAIHCVGGHDSGGRLRENSRWWRLLAFSGAAMTKSEKRDEKKQDGASDCWPDAMRVTKRKHFTKRDEEKRVRNDWGFCFVVRCCWCCGVFFCYKQQQATNNCRNLTDVNKKGYIFCAAILCFTFLLFHTKPFFCILAELWNHEQLFRQIFFQKSLAITRLRCCYQRLV